MFEINNISKKYGKKEVLSDISLTLNPGDTVGILGINGSGKSTLLACIAAYFAKDSNINSGYVPQENPLFDELKPIDNIRMWTDMSKSQILNSLNQFPLSDMGITDFLNVPVKKMSGGMKKRLSLATALINKPDILLLDEPFAALDLVTKQDILHYMSTFRENNGTIIVASHDEDIFNFCSKVYLLKNGVLTDTDKLHSNGIGYADILRS